MPPPASPPPTRSLWLLGLAVAVGYAVLGHLGLSFAFYQENATLIWAPSGLAIAAVWLLGPRMLPAVLVGSVVTNLLVKPDLLLALGIAVGNTFEAAIAGRLADRLGLGKGLHAPRDVLVYLVGLVGGATAVSALNGVAWLVLVDDLPLAQAPMTGLIWWLGDAGGVLVVTSLVISFARPRNPTPPSRLDLGLLVVTATAAAAVGLGPWFFEGATTRPLASVAFILLPYPVVGWATMRLGLRGATATTAAVALAATIGTAAGLGPFQTGDPHVDIVSLWPLLASLSVSAMVLGSALEDAHGARLAHAEGEARLAFALEAAHAQAFERDLTLDARALAEGRAPELGPAYDGLAPEDEARVRAALTRCVEGRRSGWSVDYRLGERHLSEKARVIAGAERAAGLRLDLTEQRRAEETRLALERELERTRRLGELGLLAGGIAHDFNNLLTIIRASADLASMDTAELRAECLRDIAEATLRGRELTERLLAYAGHRAVAYAPVDLSALAAETARLLASSRPRGAELEVAVGGPAWVEGDPVQLRQVVLNLVLNAFDAMVGREGMVTVGVEAHHGTALLTVRDEGHGMPPEVAARVFEPFFSTKAHGRGMGLAAVRGLVHAHGGTLEVESTPDVSTTFRARFPLAAQALEALPEHALPPDEAGPGVPRTILVVEDEPHLRKLAMLVLERAGHEVMAAGTRAEALAATESLHPDLAIVDVMLDGDNGLEVLRALRQRHPQLAAVMMSAFHDIAVPPELPLLRKPFDARALVAVVEAALPPTRRAPRPRAL